MTRVQNIALLCATSALVMTGCKKTADNTINYTHAINIYYASHPVCLWSDPIKFPVQADTSDTAKTSGYDALVDQNLLQRSTAEKKVFIIASKQVTNYDLSENGRTQWTPDPTQPGFGNFCYGHRTVQGIDSSTPTTDQPGATTQVSYHYTLGTLPGWAAAPETQNAFPAIRTATASPAADSATLLNTTEGWQMKATPSSSHKPITGADGKIVE